MIPSHFTASLLTYTSNVSIIYYNGLLIMFSKSAVVRTFYCNNIAKWHDDIDQTQPLAKVTNSVVSVQTKPQQSYSKYENNPPLPPSYIQCHEHIYIVIKVSRLAVRAQISDTGIWKHHENIWIWKYTPLNHIIHSGIKARKTLYPCVWRPL